MLFTNMWSPIKADVERLTSLFQYKNISRAAEALGMTQPQLSKELARIEFELGTKIFVRRPQGLEMSQEGEKLREKLKMLDDYWSQLGQVDEEKKGLHGNIALGCHPTIAMKLFPSVLHSICSENPGLNLQTTLLPSIDVSQQVRNLRLDLGIVINAIKSPELVVRKIDSEFIGVWGSKGDGVEKVLYYHPDMYQIQRTLKKFKNLKRVAIGDYEAIALTLKNHSDAIGILPSPSAERHGLKMKGHRLVEVQLSLVAHRERLEQKNIKGLFQEIQKKMSARS